MKRQLLLVLTISAGVAWGQPDIATGSWSWSGTNDSGGSLIAEQTGNRVRFQLEVQRGGPSYNSGFIEGEFALAANKGAFQADEKCAIAFEFRKNSAVLEQRGSDSDCGFGFGVYADGTYKRHSRKKPQFSKGDPRGPDQ